MPAKNVLKPYAENSYYHLYNRGVEKRTIFVDDQDYRVFLYYLKLYLSSPEELDKYKGVTFVKPPRQRPLNNYYGDIFLLAYCLMPNHFHLIIKQKPSDGIDRFMQSLGTKYVQYFNNHYKRVGSLFQGTYRGVLISSEEQLLHLSRYIHINVLAEKRYSDKEVRKRLVEAYSSYADYLGRRKSSWLNPEIVLAYFKGTREGKQHDYFTYQSFVEGYVEGTDEILRNLTLDDTKV